MHHLDQFKKSAAVGEITRKFSTNENTFTVGGSYAIDSLTVVKAKLNNHGKLGALLQHEVIPKSVLTVFGEVDTKALKKIPSLDWPLLLGPEGLLLLDDTTLEFTTSIQFFGWRINWSA